MGVFGINEIMANLASPAANSRPSTARVTSLWPTRKDFRAAVSGRPARHRASASLLGMLPGGGAVLSSFAAYTVEKKVARDPSPLRPGAIEGVAGPESANNAAAQTSFIPLLTLGIPSNAVMALMMGAHDHPGHRAGHRGDGPNGPVCSGA